jgi:hypothetical protein
MLSLAYYDLRWIYIDIIVVKRVKLFILWGDRMKLSTLSKFVIVSALALVTVFASHSTARAYSCDPNGNIHIHFDSLFPPSMQSVSVEDPCVTTVDNPLSSVRGYAFLDANANGKWDVGETIFGEAWYKVTNGGSWYACGYVGTDASYGVTVNPGTYYVLPVAPKGFKATTPRIEVTVGTSAALNTNIGFVADPTAKGEACDQYNPVR